MPASYSSAERSIAMWGPPSTGKTTFLAALSIALDRQWDNYNWRVTGADQASNEKLSNLTNALTQDRCFPNATQGIEHNRWVLMGRVLRTIPRRWWFGYGQREETVRIFLDFVDASGEIAGPANLEGSLRGDLIDNLAHSNGIIFLYDPVREFSQGDAFEHTFSVLNQLAQRMVDSPAFTDGRLPHYVAVCITKFDDIRVLAMAEKLELLSYDPDPPKFPRVSDYEARDLFAELCSVSLGGGADRMMRTLEQHFRRERIKYFATSAIGFYLDPRTGIYDPEDNQNVLSESHMKSPRIRGPVHPINVVEPLMWLDRMLAGEPGD